MARAMALQIGPYTVHGDLHTAAGVDPLIFFRRRRSMVPLTDATIEYATATGPVREYAGTVVVNRELLDWIREVAPAAEAARRTAPAHVLRRPTR